MKPRAFTLLETLLVIVIAGLLIGSAAMFLRGPRDGRALNQAVVTVSGILNHARQEAVTTNTCVYVALGNDRAGALWLVTFSPDDDRHRPAWPPPPLTLPAPGWRLATAPRSVPNILLNDSGALATASLPEPAAGNPNISPLAEAAVTVSVNGRPLTLNRLLLFTPDGQAMAEAELNQCLEFSLLAATDRAAKDPAVFRLSGNLGAITVYRQ